MYADSPSKSKAKTGSVHMCVTAQLIRCFFRLH